MKKYELVVIFDPSLGEAQINEFVQKLETLARNSGADAVQIDKWGKKDLAFPIKKFKVGFFVGFVMQTESSGLVDLLRAQLRIMESVIRFQIHLINVKRRKVKPVRNVEPNVVVNEAIQVQ